MGEATDVTLYVPPDKPWDLRLRSNQSFKLELEKVVRLWRSYAKARGDDESKIDLSYVMRRLLEAGITEAFTEYGHTPKTAEDWTVIEAAVLKNAKKK